MLFQLNIYRSQKDGGGSTTAPLLETAQRSYFQFLESKCNSAQEQAIPIYLRISDAQFTFPEQFSAYLNSTGSTYSFTDLWGELQNDYGDLNVNYGKYLLLASDLKDNPEFRTNSTLHDLVNDYEVLKEKLLKEINRNPDEKPKMIAAEVYSPIANVVFLAAKLNPNFNSSLAFSKSITDIKNINDVITILIAGMNQIDGAQIPSSIPAGHKINMDEQMPFAEKSTSALFPKPAEKAVPRDYARRWISPLSEIDNLMRNSYYGGNEKDRGLLQLQAEELCEKSGVPKRSNSGQPTGALKAASNFYFDNDGLPFNQAEMDIADKCTTGWRVRDVILAKMAQDGYLDKIFALFNISGDAGSTVGSFPGGNKEIKNTLNLVLNQILANSLRETSYRYLSRLILSAQGNSSDVLWYDPSGISYLEKILGKAPDPNAQFPSLAPFSYPVGSASNERVALWGYEKVYKKVLELVDEFCLKNNLQDLVYNIKNGQADGSIDKATGYYMPVENGVKWELTTDELSGQQVVAPPALVPLIEKGKLTSKAITTIIYNQMPWERRIHDANMVPVDEVIRWTLAWTEKNLNSSGVNKDFISKEFGGKKLLSVGKDGKLDGGDSIVSVKYFPLLPGGALDLPATEEEFSELGKDFASEADAEAEGYAPFFYLENASTAEALDTFISKRVDDGSENSSHPLYPFLATQRGLRLHTDSYGVLEMSKLTSEENLKPNQNEVKVKYVGKKFITPLKTEADPDKSGEYMTTYGLSSIVTNKDDCVAVFRGYNEFGVATTPIIYSKNGEADIPIEVPEELIELFYDPTQITTSIDHDDVQIGDDSTVYDAEIATISYENAKSFNTYVGGGIGEKDPRREGQFLAFTGLGGNFLPDYASVALDGGVLFNEIQHLFLFDRKFAVVKVPREDKFEPGGWGQKPPREQSSSEYGELTPGPNTWVNGKIIVPKGRGETPGNLMFYLSSQDTDFVGSPFIDMGGTPQTHITPLEGIPSSLCVFGYTEGTDRNFNLLPIGVNGEEITAKKLSLYTTPDEYNKRVVYLMVPYGDKPSADPANDLWVGTAIRSDDGRYTMEPTQNILERRFDFFDPTGFWKKKLSPYIIFTNTDEYGSILRNGKNPDGNPIYKTLQFDQRGVKNSVPVPIPDKGLMGYAQNMDDLKKQLEDDYGVDFETNFKDVNFELPENGRIDMIIMDKEGTPFRIVSEDSSLLGKKTTSINIYEANSQYQQFLSRIKDASSQFYLAPGGLISPDMYQLNAEYDDATKKFTLKLDLSKVSAEDGTSAGSGLAPLVYYNPSSSVQYEIIDAGVANPLWGPLLHLTDEQKVQNATKERMK